MRPARRQTVAPGRGGSRNLHDRTRRRRPVVCFLPICQLHGAHASVDVFTGFLPPVAQRAIVAFWEIVLGATILLIAWRLHVGLEGKLKDGEMTFLLRFPAWWAYAASFVAACVIALHCAVARRRHSAMSLLELGFLSFPVLLARLKSETYSTFSSYSLSTIPMSLVAFPAITLFLLPD